MTHNLTPAQLALALEYAMALGEYHAVNEHAKKSGLREDAMSARYAYDSMCEAQNKLNVYMFETAEL